MEPLWFEHLMPIIKVLYYPGENVYRLPDGKRIVSLQPLVTPNQEYIFKAMRRSVQIHNHHYGLRVDLLYPI